MSIPIADLPMVRALNAMLAGLRIELVDWKHDDPQRAAAEGLVELLEAIVAVLPSHVSDDTRENVAMAMTDNVLGMLRGWSLRKMKDTEQLSTAIGDLITKLSQTMALMHLFGPEIIGQAYEERDDLREMMKRMRDETKS